MRDSDYRLTMGRGDVSAATSPASQDCTARSGPDYERYQHQLVYRIGIYGWRKRCLYFLVILLMAVVIINLALTVWIIKVVDFSIDGMGSLRVVDQGLRLEGKAEFLHGLYASQICSRKDEPLKVESSENVTINARNNKGLITNRIFVGNSVVESITEEFLIKEREGRVVFRVDRDEVMVAADKFRVSGSGGVIFDGSIQTPLVRSESFQQLRLESPTRTLKVGAPEGVAIESRAGDITAACRKDLTLRSKEGKIWFDSEKIELKNIKIALPTTRGRTYAGIYQLCVCENGRLFLSPPEGHCQADDVVCK
ncbi:zeta-sarcoglycan-like isoform X2 [Tachypleus tridentatus]|uniref:zeta-sarcoglycan-like isoform X2 n=1 Tax=Tachypleus tridentatus TaxID=6853 RepID=UPI003FD1E886